MIMEAIDKVRLVGDDCVVVYPIEASVNVHAAPWGVEVSAAMRFVGLRPDMTYKLRHPIHVSSIITDVVVSRASMVGAPPIVRQNPPVRELIQRGLVPIDNELIITVVLSQPVSHRMHFRQQLALGTPQTPCVVCVIFDLSEFTPALLSNTAVSIVRPARVALQSDASNNAIRTLSPVLNDSNSNLHLGIWISPGDGLGVINNPVWVAADRQLGPGVLVLHDDPAVPATQWYVKGHRSSLDRDSVIRVSLLPSSPCNAQASQRPVLVAAIARFILGKDRRAAPNPINVVCTATCRDSSKLRRAVTIVQELPMVGGYDGIEQSGLWDLTALCDAVA